MIVINLIFLIILGVATSWSLHNLRELEKTERIKKVIVTLLIVIVLTIVTFNLSKLMVSYPNEEIENANSKVLILEYIGINALVFMPIYTMKTAKKKNSKFNKEKKQLLIFSIIIITVMCIEYNIMIDSQSDIIDTYNELVNKTN